jgi:serine protease Do
MTQLFCILKYYLRSTILMVVVMLSTTSYAEQAEKTTNNLADVISPLLPSVVNIQTIKHTESSANSIWQKMFFSDKIKTFAQNYKLPFFDKQKDDEDSNVNSIGSGFIIDEKGFIVTNYHVVESADEIFVKLASDMEYPAHLIGSDPKTDLALLKIETDSALPHVIFGDSDELRVGDTVIAIGNPLGLGGSVTTGIISFKGRDIDSNKESLVDNFLQTDATINIGNSGGPLFNIHGEVIGLNSSIPKIGNGANVGIGFAVPSNTVKTIVLELRDKGQINRGKIGITVQMITNELADALSVKHKEGIVIVAVQENGPGDKAGLNRGDVITKFNNQKVISPRKLELLVAECDIDSEVEIEISREDKLITSRIKIIGQDVQNDLPQEEQALEVKGVIFSNINAKNAKRFGLLPEAKGIFIEKIDNKLQTELQVNDVILAINNQTITNTQQFHELCEALKKDNKNKTVLLVRRGELEILLPYNF